MSEQAASSAAALGSTSSLTLLALGLLRPLSHVALGVRVGAGEAEAAAVQVQQRTYRQVVLRQPGLQDGGCGQRKLRVTSGWPGINHPSTSGPHSNHGTCNVLQLTTLLPGLYTRPRCTRGDGI